MLHSNWYQTGFIVWPRKSSWIQPKWLANRMCVSFQNVNMCLIVFYCIPLLFSLYIMPYKCGWNSYWFKQVKCFHGDNKLRSLMKGKHLLLFTHKSKWVICLLNFGYQKFQDFIMTRRRKNISGFYLDRVAWSQESSHKRYSKRNRLKQKDKRIYIFTRKSQWPWHQS